METTETLREPRRLVRPRDRRWLGGVASGLGSYFDLSPTIYRIAFVALALAGGTGVLLYIAAWVVIPEEGEADSIAASFLKREHEHPTRAVGIAILAFIAIVVIGSADVWPDTGNVWLAAALAGGALVWWQLGGRRAAAPGGASTAGPALRGPESLFPLAAGGLLVAVGAIALLDLGGVWNADWRWVLGAMVIALGAVVALGAVTGRSIGGVLGIGLLMIAALALTLAVRVPLFVGFGDRTEHPLETSALQDTYELGIGSFHVDVSDLAMAKGRTTVKATLGIGDLTVRVPDDVTVDVEARAGAGDLIVFGEQDDGTSVHTHVRDPGTDGARVLVLDARVGLGRVTVVRG
jgi:phage shock protein PspC (stress-responsive transcriptional regulator)